MQKRQLLPESIWKARAKAHSESVSPLADGFLNRRAARQKHPVHDFLFTYYSFSPLKLKQWVPSYTEELKITATTRRQHPWLNSSWFKLEEEILTFNPERVQENTRALLQFLIELCKNISQRQPRFGCFGLHEWAMVYKSPADEIRHQGYRLRLPPDELAKFVESQNICCSHYDAYRFFTPEAQPLNILKPVIDTRLEMEQGGCLHANMDLYKWATKLWPWIGSDFIGKAFLLALEGRELDMRASPYDLSDEGYEPICIETEAGRKQYQHEQQRYAEKTSVLRLELLRFCEDFLTYPCTT